MENRNKALSTVLKEYIEDRLNVIGYKGIHYPKCMTPSKYSAYCKVRSEAVKRALGENCKSRPLGLIEFYKCIDEVNKIFRENDDRKFREVNINE